MKWLLVLTIYSCSLFSAARLRRIITSPLLDSQLGLYARRLADVPGYDRLMRVLEGHRLRNNAQGIESVLFELHTATVLQDQGHTIVGLDVKPDCRPRCEIDVQTDTLCVECKSGRCASNFTEYCQQFKRQQRATQQLGLRYAVYFKKTPPSSLQTWLAQKKIPCIVLPQEA